MAVGQVPHFDASGSAADIADGLEAGEYLAQMRGYTNTVARLLYATAAAEPADDDDYFAVAGEGFFRFCAPGPVFVKSIPGLSVSVALARIGP